MEPLGKIRSWRKKFRKRRQAIVELRLPADQELASVAKDAVLLAMKKGLNGEAAREFAIKAVAKHIEGCIKGNPDHPLGRFIEAVDDVLPVAVEAVYQGIKVTLKTKK